MAPRHTYDWADLFVDEEEEACYTAQTRADEHDDWVSSTLFRLQIEEKYLEMLMEQVESLCQEYIRVLLAGKNRWTAAEMHAMEMEIKSQRDRVQRCRRVHKLLKTQIATLQRLQLAFYDQSISFETYVESSRIVANDFV